MKPIAQLLPFLLVLVVVLGCRSGEVTPAEKEMFVRGGEFKDLGVEVSQPERYEKFSKTKYFDGSFDIDYEFDVPEGENLMYIAETITIERKKSDAKLGQIAEDSGIGLALMAQGLEKVEIPDFFKYGDSSTFYSLKKDGVIVGNYFTVLEDKKVYSILITGVYVDDPETWRDLVEPKLKLFSSYKQE